MKGLYIKDFKLLKNQKNFFIILGLIAIFFAISQTNASFVVSYATFISTTFVISSISYDEFNNGNAFLFTLPISKQEYVKEKYLFGLTLSICPWLFTTILIYIINLIKGTDIVIKEWLFLCTLILMIAIIMEMIIIPVQLKFGQNKGNIAMLLVMGGSFGLGYILVKLFDFLGIELGALIKVITTLGFLNLVIVAVIVILVMIISYLISCKIMIKKEF